LICETVRHLVKELGDAKPLVEALIKEGALRSSDFDYPTFNNGCETIP